MKSEVVFANEKLKKSFENLKNSGTEDRKIYKYLLRAFEDLEDDAFSGIQLPKKLIPKEYGKVENLWKYNLPDAWRLIYTVRKENVLVLSMILEWLGHKSYERRFKY